MPTIKLQLHVFSTLVLALVCLLVSCPADNPPSDSNTQSSVSGTVAIATPVVPEAVVTKQPEPEPTQGSEKEVATQDPVVEEPSPTKEASGEEEKAEDNELEVKPPMSKNYRAPEKKSNRPKKKTGRKKSFKSVEMRLIGAEYNDAEDATLSKLSFEFRANLGRKKREIKLLELDDINALVVEKFDLGLCKVEIYPVVNQPDLDDVGSLGSIELLFKGMFQIRVYLPDDELIGIFGIYADGTFGVAPWGKRPDGYLVKSMKREESYGPKPFTIYKKTPVGEKPEYLVTIQFNGGGFGEQTVDDPKGHRYKYRFPVGCLELFDPNEV